MNDADEVLRQIDYRRFYSRYIPSFNSNGKTEVSCLCPFHDDKEPSLSVNVETGLWNCFGGCGAGNAIQFLQRKENIDFKVALEKVKREEGIDPSPNASPSPESSPGSGQAPKGAATQKGEEKKGKYLTLDQIELIHQQLLKNESVLKEFQDKYGLSIETIKKYKIGYQNEHYVIPIEVDSPSPQSSPTRGEEKRVEPGKWTFKEHKGSQLQGSKAILYPSDVVKRFTPHLPSPQPSPIGRGREGQGEMEYIIITEGEFKALLLAQLGFPAISPSAGANTWKKEWNQLFADLDVILCYDNDDAGRQGQLKTAENLKGIAKSVKAVQWPPEMDSKEKKDVTDFFIKLKKAPEDFQKLLNTAKEIGAEIKEIDGIKFIESEGFRVESDCIKQHINHAGGSFYKTIFYSPLFITGRALDVDTGMEEAEIAFKRDRKLKRLWIPKRIVSDAKKIVEYSDHGLPVNSSNSKRIIEYLSAFESFNMNLIPKTFVAKGVGWKTVEDKRVFILNKMVSRQGTPQPNIEFTPEAGFERFVKALKPEGNYVKWRECISEALKYPYAAFAFYASFAAPLLRILKAPNFIIDFWGNTSVGKTTVLELAASVWGSPHKEAGGLVFSWDSTRVFLERMASFFCDVPIFPDDSQTVDDRTMTSMLYQISNGVGKGRGSPVGIRHTPTWHTVCFSTGEQPLTECTAFGGARARTIEIYGSPFPNAGGEFINDLKTGIRENYGHAGVKFIEGLLSIWHNHDEMTRLKAEYKRYQRELSLEANSEVGDRFSHYFAVIKVAADFVHQILGIGDTVEAEESIYRVFNNLITESIADVDSATRAMEYVLSWVSGNENYFKGNEKEEYGIWRSGEYIGIFPHKLSEVFKERKFSERAILKGWTDRGWIKREGKHFSCTRRVEIKDGSIQMRRFVIIPWSVFEGFIER